MSAARGSPGFAARVFRGDARCSTGREPRRSLPPRAARAASSDHPRGDRGTEKARRGVPHSGYHRTVGARRPFFEGWYFRVTLPEARDNLSLIYHVYDPDLRDSPRRAAGAQVCTPGGGYLFRESQDVDAFAAAPHALALRMPMGRPNDAASSSAEVSEERFFLEFFEVSDDGRRHRGCLVASATREDESIWPSAKRVERVAWDFSVSVRAGFGANGDADSTHRSTAGWLSALPVFEPHYQILMAHGLATGHVTVDGEKTAFANAPAYAEKNWGGAGFPSKWFWTQCNAFPSAPGVSVTATGANRGVVLVPGMREEVAGILIHVPVAPGSNASGTDGETDEETGAASSALALYQFLPIRAGGEEPAEIAWRVAPWGSWRVSAKTSTHECVVSCCIDPKDARPGNTTVLRAPVDDHRRGMEPSCRESFRGRMTVSLWERKGRGWGSGARGRALLDAVVSDVAAVEVGGGPWDETWEGTAEMREPLGTLAGAEVDVRAVADFFAPLGDVAPGL